MITHSRGFVSKLKGNKLFAKSESSITLFNKEFCDRSLKDHLTVKSESSWDIFECKTVYFKQKCFQGRKKLRKIIIEEVYDSTESINYVIILILQPVNRQRIKRNVPKDINDSVSVVSEVSRISEFSEYSRVSGVSESSVLKKYEDWSVRHKFNLECISLKKSFESTITITNNVSEKSRDYTFNSPEDTDIFFKYLNKKKEKIYSNDVVKYGNRHTAIVEIISATFLTNQTIWNSVPVDLHRMFIVVKFNGKVIHTTLPASHHSHVIWTVETNSIFLFSFSSEDMVDGKLLFELKRESKTNVTGRTLGTLSIDLEKLLNSKGDRNEFKFDDETIEKPLEQSTSINFLAKTRNASILLKSSIESLFISGDKPGKLAIWCRKATRNDILCLSKIAAGDRLLSPYEGGFSFDKVFYKVEENQNKKEIFMKNLYKGFGMNKSVKGGVKQYRIKPGPDPKCKEETTWMTKERINKEALGVSKCWLDIGSGTLAQIYLEIIGCDNLPNFDAIRGVHSKHIESIGSNVSEFVGDKTDSCVAILYEDAIARTDRIDDCLSPRWMPWTQRSFILNTMYASSKIYLAVFDVDTLAGITTHELIGRVVVNLTNFHFRKEYLLHYKLRAATRDDRGTITIRLRIECPDERSFLLSSLRLPKPLYLNINSQSDYFLAKKILYGEKICDEFCLSTILEHIDEIKLFPAIFIFSFKALFFTLLWRGHFRTTILIPRISHEYKFYFQRTFVLLPLHSMAAFFAGITLIEYPSLIFPYFFLTIGWLMIACMEFRNSFTSTWCHCRTFRDFLNVLIYAKSTHPTNIKPQTEIQFGSRAESIHESYHEAEEQLKSAISQYTMMRNEALKEVVDLNLDEEITKQNTNSLMPDVILNPLKPKLFPVQQKLKNVCTFLRYFLDIFFWRESHISFWVTFLSFTFAIITFLIPRIMLIIIRLFTWSILGPWMKLVDKYFSRDGNEIDIGQLQDIIGDSQIKSMNMALQRKILIRENNMKLKAMKNIMFGRYMLHIPTFDTGHEYDLPLPSSSSVNYDANLLQLATGDKIKIPGQEYVIMSSPLLKNEK